MIAKLLATVSGMLVLAGVLSATSYIMVIDLQEPKYPRIVTSPQKISGKILCEALTTDRLLPIVLKDANNNPVAKITAETKVDPKETTECIFETTLTFIEPTLGQGSLEFLLANAGWSKKPSIIPYPIRFR